MKGILRYLKGTADHFLCLGGEATPDIINQSPRLQLFADADWANDPMDRKSISGYLLTLGTGAFSWKAKKQDIVASSTTEAECISLWTGAKHAEHISYFLQELQYPLSRPILAHQDNKSTITVCEMPRPKSKYIDVKHCVVRDQVNRKVLELQHCPTKKMTADILTKALPAPQFRELLPQLGMVPSTSVVRQSLLSGEDKAEADGHSGSLDLRGGVESRS